MSKIKKRCFCTWETVGQILSLCRCTYNIIVYQIVNVVCSNYKKKYIKSNLKFDIDTYCFIVAFEHVM